MLVDDGYVIVTVGAVDVRSWVSKVAVIVLVPAVVPVKVAV
jgi:hypothetical protein